jgi:hypothetical protein
MRRVVLVTAIAAVAAASYAVGSIVSGGVAGSSFVIDAPASLAPRMDPAGVANLAQARLQEMAADAQAAGLRVSGGSIQKVILARNDELGAVEPRAAGGEGSPDRLLWVVRATGTFVTNRGPIGGTRSFASGYFLIDDATGEIIGMGMP